MSAKDAQVCATTADEPVIAAAGMGVVPEPIVPPADVPVGEEVEPTSGDNHSEVAWRLRHARRGILKDVDVPEEIVVGDTPPDSNIWGSGSMLGSPARLASSLFASTAFTGQVNLRRKCNGAKVQCRSCGLRKKR